MTLQRFTLVPVFVCAAAAMLAAKEGKADRFDYEVFRATGVSVEYPKGWNVKGRDFQRCEWG